MSFAESPIPEPIPLYRTLSQIAKKNLRILKYCILISSNQQTIPFKNHCFEYLHLLCLPYVIEICRKMTTQEREVETGERCVTKGYRVSATLKTPHIYDTHTTEYFCETTTHTSSTDSVCLIIFYGFISGSADKTARCALLCRSNLMVQEQQIMCHSQNHM